MISYHRLARDASLYVVLSGWDRRVAEEVRAAGCACGGVLHRADYPRKPRGGPRQLSWDMVWRFSFCCCEEGCRRRSTPPSVRFLGRRVYLAAVVVLTAVLYGGLTEERAGRLSGLMGVPRRTLTRWLTWWREEFVVLTFWSGNRALFAPPVDASGLPASLLDRFAGRTLVEKLQKCLEFLSPLTTGSCRWEASFSMGV